LDGEEWRAGDSGPHDDALVSPAGEEVGPSRLGEADDGIEVRLAGRVHAGTGPNGLPPKLRPDAKDDGVLVHVDRTDRARADRAAEEHVCLGSVRIPPNEGAAFGAAKERMA